MHDDKIAKRELLIRLFVLFFAPLPVQFSLRQTVLIGGLSFIFKPYCQFPHPPQSSLYVSCGTNEENLFSNQGLLYHLLNLLFNAESLYQSVTHTVNSLRRTSLGPARSVRLRDMSV